MNVLFICSRNEWRSRTAEKIFKNENAFKVRSAGTSRSARIRVSKGLIDWADKIFVMEDKHKKRLQEMYAHELNPKEIIVLGIPDVYQFMDEELIAELKDLMSFYLPNI